MHKTGMTENTTARHFCCCQTHLDRRSAGGETQRIQWKMGLAARFPSQREGNLTVMYHSIADEKNIKYIHDSEKVTNPKQNQRSPRQRTTWQERDPQENASNRANLSRSFRLSESHQCFHRCYSMQTAVT